MFRFIIEASVRFRWFVVLATALVAALGLFELTKLPIDAVPDITNRQVQITTVAPALAPVMASIAIRPSARIASSTPQVKAPWAPPPCKARLTDFSAFGPARPLTCGTRRCLRPVTRRSSRHPSAGSCR